MFKLVHRKKHISTTQSTEQASLSSGDELTGIKMTWHCPIQMAKRCGKVNEEYKERMRSG
jgi:hypothetical protein